MPIKPLLHLFDQSILLVNSALDFLDIHSIRWFHIPQYFGHFGQILVLAHADGWLRRPLLRQKDMGFFHWRSQEFELLPVENEGVFGFALTTAEVVVFKEGADGRVLDKGEERLPVAGRTPAAIKVLCFITLGGAVEGDIARVPCIAYGLSQYRRDRRRQWC